MPVQDYYNFEGRGVIRSKPAGTRVFLFSSRTWAKIESELFKTFSSGAAVMLGQMGASYGVHVIKEMKLVTKDPRHAMETLEGLTEASGWGDVTVLGDLASGDSFDVEFRECVFCADSPRSDVPSCYFLQGLTRGIANELYGSTHDVAERSCIRKGDAACVFSATLST